MNLFENQKYYSKDSFDKISYDDQQEIFLRIRAWLPQVDERVRYDKDKFRKIIIKRLEQVCAYACAGHIPSQDYMGYIYKRGFADIIPINYKRSIEWSIIASRNGSKLAPQRMKTFMDPAVDMVMLSDRWGEIIKYNSLNKKNYFWFLCQYICEVLYIDLKLDPVEMAKKDLIEEDTNEKKARIFFDRFRDRSVESAIEKLLQQLPKDEEKSEGNDEDDLPIFLDDDNTDKDVFAELNIEDIDQNDIQDSDNVE